MNNRWSFLILLAVLSPVIGIFFGAADLPPKELYQCVVGQCSTQINSLIFWEIRLPRVLVGFLVGAGLAVAGATLQNITLSLIHI